ncbi:hypothetical protein [Kineococcus sp. SYSU DK004]|uniref:hypothetical protein n=1 Tax=Kineococcus sp. SYSU DK004 TaxID=3383125 RepID=UPI003D7EAD68
MSTSAEHGEKVDQVPDPTRARLIPLLAAMLVLAGAIGLSLLLITHPEARTGIVAGAAAGGAVVAGYWLKWSSASSRTRRLEGSSTPASSS